MSCKDRNCGGNVNRRGFIGFIVSVIASISALTPLAAFSKEKWVSVGKRDDFTDGGFNVIEGEKIFVFRKGDSFSAMSGKCTHFGCLVERQADGSFLCPCHASVFDGKGGVKKGPAKKDLVWHNVKVMPTGEVMVDVKSEVAP
ncbi:MAG: Rieske (2Fe-2S) protein [Deltaproteobacteria bacterium]|uniref:Rieske (2Fe-2S) protein n=1 Tax=Candidatus Zymogenus saltonus TaxID=2844893 RepID=A0A9D8PNA3_9DELT|nr:Rieske (2Fe-2S) protein [Candidatus Zymogenus saltonus]